VHRLSTKAIHREFALLEYTSHTIFFGFYSRVVEAKAPMAIVIPVRGSLLIKGLRVDDLSWQDFLGRVNYTE
jgi:hypothetical protein